MNFPTASTHPQKTHTGCKLGKRVLEIENTGRKISKHFLKISAISVLVFIFAPVINGQQGVTVYVNSKATYLRTNQDSNSTNAVAIDLLSIGIAAGDYLRLEQRGAFSYYTGCPTCVPPIPPEPETATRMVGVFSSTNILLSSSQQFRVPDALELPQIPNGNTYNIVTENTLMGSLPTDISQDFYIKNSDPTEAILVKVPEGARYLFVSANDSFYGDNGDANFDYTVLITKCVVPGLTILTGTALQWDNLVLMNQPVPVIPRRGGGIVDNARQCLMMATNGSLQTTSWWRPLEYQRHFFEIKDRWYIKGLENCDAPECQALKTEVRTHREKHGIGTVVCNPDAPSTICPHPDGRAFDASEDGITTQMLNSCNLYRRYPENDGVHLELIPTPTLESISPASIVIGNNGNSLKIKIKGKKFYQGSKAYWNGEERPTIVLKKESQLQVTIPANDLQNAGTYSITVTNPNFSPLLGSGTSNPKTFIITQSALEDNQINEQMNSLQAAPRVLDPRVSVRYKQELVDGVVRYSYRVVNNSHRPINNLIIGYDNQNNYTLEYPPVGWDIFTATPASSFTSPANWTFDVLWDEETDLEVTKWRATQSTAVIPPNTTRSGFSVIVPEIDPTYASWFSVTLDDGTGISASMVPDITPFDFDGDGKADQTVFRPSSSVWYLLNSQTGFIEKQFGISSDRISPADFDGDGRTDISVFRNGTWYWLNSSNGNFNAVQFGIAGDIPIPADYTGDGRAELAVFRSGTWYTLNLTNNQFQAVAFGTNSDKPVAADFDGDGKTDFAVYRDGIWYWLRSSDNNFNALQFGIASDKPTVGDFDGDSKADQAVYRSGAWHILGSTQGFSTVQFGNSSDIPVAADYDGDGKTDIAVFREGVWHLLRTQEGFGTVQFGVANDIPSAAAFVP